LLTSGIARATYAIDLTKCACSTILGGSLVREPLAGCFLRSLPTRPAALPPKRERRLTVKPLLAELHQRSLAKGGVVVWHMRFASFMVLCNVSPGSHTYDSFIHNSVGNVKAMKAMVETRSITGSFSTVFRTGAPGGEEIPVAQK